MPRWTSVMSNTLGASCADIMGTLADETRLKVVELLLARARNVRDLNGELNMDATLLSHHLRVLREAGLVEAKRSGRFLVYSVSPRVKSARRGAELDFGCCTLRFSAGTGSKAALRA